MQDSNSYHTTVLDSARSSFRAKQTNAEAAGTYRDAPVLDAYRHPDGVHLVAWCPHEGRWHQHGICRQMKGCANVGHDFGAPGCTCPKGSGDGHRGGHCTCPLSPLRDGYYLREIGDYGPDVPNWVNEDTAPTWACQDWTGYECDGCRHDRQCSCGTVKCPDDSACAVHAYIECETCWKVHGGPDRGYCETHGIAAMHPHPDAALCQPGLDDLCEPILYHVTRSPYPVHAHCAQCWAEFSLRSRHPRSGYMYEIPACPGCRDLVTSDQIARIVAVLAEEARLFDPPTTQDSAAVAA